MATIIDHPSIIIGDPVEAANRGKAARANPNKPINFFGTSIDVSVQDNLPTTDEMRRAIRRGMLGAVVAALSAANASAPRRTGRTAAALTGSVAQAEVGTTTVGVVAVDPKREYVARFLEFGVGQHLIESRGAFLRRRASERQAGTRGRGRLRRGRRRGGAAQALAFRGIGGTQFAARVHHPGIRARHWLQQAGITATPSIIASFQEAFREAGITSA